MESSRLSSKASSTSRWTKSTGSSTSLSSTAGRCCATVLSAPPVIRDYFDRHGLEGFERPRFFRKSPIGMTCAVFSEMDEG